MERHRSQHSMPYMQLFILRNCPRDLAEALFLLQCCHVHLAAALREPVSQVSSAF